MTTYRDYTPEQIGRRGEELYEQRIRTLVEQDNFGRDVLIDIATGEWEMGDDLEEMTRRLQVKHPEAPLYHLRIGYPATARIGGRLKAIAR